MSANVKFVSPEDEAVLRKYFKKENENEGVCLIFGKECQDKLTEAGIEDGELVDYDFGCDADVWLDTVSRPDHTFMDSVLNKDE